MLRLAILATICAVADALVLGAASPALRGLSPAAATPRAVPATMQFFKKKTVEEVLEEKGYWPGEWVCADCGYVYEPGTTPAFEELRPKWKCPQCAGPRRRFVKKAGDQYGSLDDSGLFIGTAVAGISIAALVLIGLTI